MLKFTYFASQISIILPKGTYITKQFCNDEVYFYYCSKKYIYTVAGLS